MEKKYKALQAISIIYKILAGIVFFIAVFSGLGEIFLSRFPMVAVGLNLIIAGTIGALFLFAFAQLLELLIDLEQNTRQTNALLNRIGSLLAKQQRKASSGPREILGDDDLDI